MTSQFKNRPIEVGEQRLERLHDKSSIMVGRCVRCGRRGELNDHEVCIFVDTCELTAASSSSRAPCFDSLAHHWLRRWGLNSPSAELVTDLAREWSEIYICGREDERAGRAAPGGAVVPVAKKWEFLTPRVEGKCAKHATWPEPDEPCWGCEREAGELKSLYERVAKLERRADKDTEADDPEADDPSMAAFVDRFIKPALEKRREPSNWDVVDRARRLERARWVKVLRAWARWLLHRSTSVTDAEEVRINVTRGSCLEDAADVIEQEEEVPFEMQSREEEKS